MLSSQVVGGLSAADEPIVGGGTLQWVLANDGTVAWPEATTLRLVGGPALMHPAVDVPAVAPGQTVIIDLEVQESQDSAEIFYALVTPDCQPFGEIASVKVVPKP